MINDVTQWWWSARGAGVDSGSRCWVLNAWEQWVMTVAD